VPESLRFLLFMAVQVQFIAVAYLFATRHKYRWPVATAVILVSLVSSAQTGLFHNIILWSALLFSFANLELRIGRPGRYAIIGGGFVILALVQQVKGDFRQIIYNGYNGSRITLLAEMLIEPGKYQVHDPMTSELAAVNARFNQGWVISAVLNYVPSVRDFDRGESVTNAISDSILPRVLSGKRAVLVSDAFRKYTGLPVAKGTSIGISVLGEAWANFGYWGIPFMFVWGLTMSGVLALVARLAQAYPTLPLWAPLIFLQAVKAETELVVVLNHIAKASIFVALMYIGLRRFLGVRI
jgi:hypothetical protein